MIVLSDPVLGDLELRRSPYVVQSFQVGSRAVRAVTRNRALADGGFDDSRYQGGRAVTLSVRLDERACTDEAATMQSLFDRLLPYMAPRRRPVLRWSLPGSDSVQRELVVRGDSAPVVIGSSRHPSIVLSFVAADGEITSPGVREVTIDPAGDVEDGREYDLDPDRAYPPTLAIGDRLVAQLGNDLAHWELTIFGPVTDPFFRINGVEIAFDQGGGLDLVDGSSVVINTRERTIYLDGDPTEPRYDRTNFTAWSWADVMLNPGDNVVRYGDAGQARLTWRDTWAG